MRRHNNLIDRRSLLKGTLAAAAAASARRTFAATRRGKSDTDSVSLREKFFGCIAGCHIGSAMGAPVEGRSWERIEKEYGTLDKLLPYHHYGKSNDWTREPGTTEDGVERQKLMITAIIEKQDRINAEDLRRENGYSLTKDIEWCCPFLRQSTGKLRIAVGSIEGINQQLPAIK